MTVVAIDGPAGAGKSTIARRVADALGWRYVDTGALYRAVTLAVLRAGVSPSDEQKVEAVVRSAEVESDGRTVTLAGEDVSRAIRGREVSAAVPVVSAYPSVRAALLQRQRELTSSTDVVMEGRDIGTVVAPDAALKVFLTASLEERARRRALDLGLPEDPESIANTQRALDERDATDAGRSASPLARAPDAVLVDTTDKTIDEITDEIVQLVAARGRRG